MKRPDYWMRRMNVVAHRDEFLVDEQFVKQWTPLYMGARPVTPAVVKSILATLRVASETHPNDDIVRDINAAIKQLEAL
jgi:hypothetical protein